jgi:tetratricopeptide (TPR) repeat protein
MPNPAKSKPTPRPAIEAVDVASLDRRLHEALEAGQLEYAAAMMEQLASISPQAAPVVKELMPALEALERKDLEEAFFRLTEETTYDSRTEDRMLEYLGKHLEYQNKDELAAAVWLRWRDVRGKDRAEALLKKLGTTADAVKGRVREKVLAYYRERTKQHPKDAVAWERIGWHLLAAGDARGAMEACNTAATTDPTRRVSCQLIGDILLGAGRANEAVKWYESVAKANAGKPWPYVLLANAYEDRLADTDSAIRAAFKAVELGPSDRTALKVLHRLLVKSQRWHDLVDHLERMAGSTMRVTELAAIYDEIAELLAQRLSSPLEAIEFRKKAEWFRDAEEVRKFYWKALNEPGSDASTWSEVEEFFRVNEFWEDLALLLLRKADRISGSELVALYDDLGLVYAMMPGADEGAGGEAAKALAEALEMEISRQRDPDVRRQLDQRLQRAKQTIQEVEERLANKGNGGWFFRVSLLAVVTGVVLVVAAVLLLVL